MAAPTERPGPLGVCVAGITGWTGSAVAEAVAAAPDLALRCGVARSAAGREAHGARVYASAAAALDATEGVDVLVDYTSHAAVRANAEAALARGVAVVVGASGLTGAELDALGEEARRRGTGVVAAGNFSLTAALAQAAALLAARHLPHWEIVDLASAAKPDAPSGTARELAERLADVRRPEPALPVAETAGDRAARGATVAGTQVHSVRLPSFTVSTEVVFALPDERLSIRHDAGASPAPYVAGTLLAVRAAPSVTGLVRGLDALLLA